MNQEDFNKIPDLRPYFLRHPNDEKVRSACLHYLGDDFQRFDKHINSESTVDATIVNYVEEDGEIVYVAFYLNNFLEFVDSKYCYNAINLLRLSEIYGFKHNEIKFLSIGVGDVETFEIPFKLEHKIKVIKK